MVIVALGCSTCLDHLRFTAIRRDPVDMSAAVVDQPFAVAAPIRSFHQERKFLDHLDLSGPDIHGLKDTDSAGILTCGSNSGKSRHNGHKNR